MSLSRKPDFMKLQISECRLQIDRRRCRLQSAIINLQCRLPPRRLFDAIGLGGLAGFGGGAFLERGFAAQLHAAFVIDADAFHPDHFADLRDVFDAINAEVRQLRNVNKAVLARKNFDERAEIFDRNDAAMIGRADFDLSRFTWEQVNNEPGYVAATIRDTIRSRAPKYGIDPQTYFTATSGMAVSAGSFSPALR